MENTTELTPQNKERHGCVTAWLILMIVLNSLVALLYLFTSDKIAANLSEDVSGPMIILLGFMSIINVICAALLLKWKKIGFWGFLISSIAVLAINLSIGLSVTQSLIGLAGIAILYAVLQIRKNEISAWEQLD